MLNFSEVADSLTNPDIITENYIQKNEINLSEQQQFVSEKKTLKKLEQHASFSYNSLLFIKYVII